MNKIIVKLLSLSLVLILSACGDNSNNNKSIEYPERKHSGGKSEIVLAKHQLEHIDIQTEPAVTKEISIPLILRGKAALNESMTAHITSRVKGRVEKVYAVISDRVKKGQPIVDLYSQDFIALQSEFVQAEERLKRMKEGDADYQTTHSIYESARKKLEVIGLMENEIEQLADKHTPYTVISVRAPFDGTLISGEVRLGEFVDIGRDFFLLANLQNLWVLADIFEKDLPFIKEGISGVITTLNSTNDFYKGKLTRIYDIVDPAMRTVKARFEVANYNYKLKPEMFVNVAIESNLGGKYPKIKSTAVMKEKNDVYVFVAVNDTTFEKRNIELGRETKDYAEIIKGLNAGDKVVMKGTFYLKSELAKETFVEED